MTASTPTNMETPGQELPPSGSSAGSAPQLKGWAFLVSGWKGFGLWLALFLSWLAYLGYQVISQRPEPAQVRGVPASLPSRGQLTLADAVWVVQIRPNRAFTVSEVIAGKAPSPGTENQLDIADLDSAGIEAQGESPQRGEGTLWLVPVLKIPKDSHPPENQKEFWRVAPMPADPARPKGAQGKIYPFNEFNQRLIQSWWAKGE